MTEATTVRTETIPRWTLSDRMQKALRHAGINRREMAAYLDVHPNTVRNWVTGRIVPSTQSVRLWSIRCNVPYAWLAFGIEPDGDDAPGKANPGAPNGGIYGSASPHAQILAFRRPLDRLRRMELAS